MNIDAKYVAELARLELSDEEKAVFQPQLDNIVGYFEKLSALDVSGVEPMMHGRPLVNAFREDVVRPSLDREEDFHVTENTIRNFKVFLA